MSLAATRDFDLINANKPRRMRIPSGPTQEPFTNGQRQMLRGRPSSYRAEFAQDVIEKLADGFSLGGFAGQIGVDRTTLNDWRDKYPEFALACARAAAVRQLFWETKLIEVANTGGTGSQGQIAIFGVLNAGREDWKNKQEVELSGQVTFTSIVERAMKTIEAQRLGQNSAAEQPAIETDFTYSEQQVTDGFDDTF